MEEKLQSVKTIELKAKITLETYTSIETGETIEFVSTVLSDPFDDPDFTNIGIRPKWDDADIMFKFYARKALRTNPVIEFPVTIKSLSYKDKKKNKTVTYPGIIGIDPFDGREKEFKIKIKKDKGIFDDRNSVIFNNLARAALGMLPEETEE